MDAPATRVKPIPIPIIQFLIDHANTPLSHAVAELSLIGFFFLLRPGEHTSATAGSNTQPFRLEDVNFNVGGYVAPGHLIPLDTLPSATFVTLRFTRQKNGTENEVVGHGRSGHSTLCPVTALIKRVQHLRTHNAPPSTPLCTVFHNDNRPPTLVTATHLTQQLRLAAAILLPTVGFDPNDISARALRAGGAMALLCANVDKHTIQLLGRWKSDEVLRYLHLQAYPQMLTFARLMITHGRFTNQYPDIHLDA